MIHVYLHENRPLESIDRIVKLAGTVMLSCGHIHLLFLPRQLLAHNLITWVGEKPKDGDARACYVVLTLVRRNGIDLYHVPYGGCCRTSDT